MQLFRILVALLIVSTGAVAGFRQINGGAVHKATTVTTAAGTTTAIATSNQVYIFEGSTTQNFVAPNATTLPAFWYYDIINNSTGTVTFKDSTSATVGTVSGGRQGKFILSDNSTAAGTWKVNVPAAPGDIITDHGNLSGLSDDDHTQYHNDTRGDARYFRENEHVSTSSGAANAGAPIVLNSSGQVDDTMLPASSSNAWSKVGNAGLTAGTNFIGTTDAVDMVIKSNNSEIIRYKSDGTIDTTLGSGAVMSDINGGLAIRNITGNEVASTANLTLATVVASGTIQAASFNGTYASGNLVGIFNVSQGGTGISDATANQMIVAGPSGNSPLQTIITGAAGTVLRSSGPTARPQFQQIATGDIAVSTWGVPNGGTGLAAATPNSVVITGVDSTAPWDTVTPGTAGQFLKYVGAARPVWATLPSSGGTGVHKVLVDTANGYGSTNNVIARWSNSSTTGTAITYADSAANGSTFTINTTGNYCGIVAWSFNAGGFVGWSRNSTTLTTASSGEVYQIAASERLAVQNGDPNLLVSATFCAPLTAGDVIRTHNNGNAHDASTSRAFALISLIGAQ